jgi:para-nitrobenzyl esterase
VLAPPIELLARGRFNRVPVLIGTNRDEGRIFPGLAFDLLQGAPLTEDAYATLLGKLTADTPALAHVLPRVYTSARHGSPNLAVGALMTDAQFTCPSLLQSRMTAAYTPTYVYEFQDPTVAPLFPDPFMPWGAYHGAEVGMVLHPAAAYAAAPARTRALSDRMIAYWARFAATGNPNGTAPEAVYWPSANRHGLPVQRLDIGAIDTDKQGAVYHEHRCQVWDFAFALRENLF